MNYSDFPYTNQIKLPILFYMKFIPQLFAHLNINWNINLNIKLIISYIKMHGYYLEVNNILFIWFWGRVLLSRPGTHRDLSAPASQICN